jgi:serine/threonine protein kinase/formylglycine-generating enzyme required for sulfatase activity
LDSEFFKRISEIFEEARRLDGGARRQYLEEACAGDAAIRGEVDSLLASHDDGGGILGETELGHALGASTASLLGTAELASSSERIGPYRVLDVLGEGGMGIVYLAEQTHPVRRKVALKAIKLGMDSREVLTRFEAERQALALMNHPNIAQVYDAGHDDDGRPYFVMEFVPGTPLTKYADEHKLDIRERLLLFVQICHGVQHAHHRGILHRDLKPSNVLVTSPDEGHVAKIIDFGVAKATSQRLTEKTLHTEFGRAVGTPAYMSPELAEMSADEPDNRSDIYSLGVLLYELLVGELPFDREELREAAYDKVIRAIREEDPPTPSSRWTRLSNERTTGLAAMRRSTTVELARELRGGLDWVVMRAMEKDRRRRYLTASAFAADVERYLNNEPVDASPPSVVYRTRKFVARNRGPVLAALGIMLSLAIGLVVSLQLFLSEKETASRLLNLSDGKRLQDYTVESTRLFPAIPENEKALRDWIQGAEELVKRLPAHRLTLAQLEASGKDDLKSQWWRGLLAKLVEDLEVFQGENPEKGLLVKMRARYEFASTIRECSLEKPAQLWKEAIDSIANRQECPQYHGLRIKPQLGLVSLGRDAQSGLWEFGHLETGALPRREADGRLALEDGSGIVFVLLPGGTFKMGTELPSDDKPASLPNVDPFSQGAKEGPIHDVTLSPFFMSKYEMTQGQWQYFTGSNPSGGPPGGIYGAGDVAKKITWMHPVESVSWEMCALVLERLGLRFPTEAQWEYAARAGTATTWWTGNDVASVEGTANLADQFARKWGGGGSWQSEAWDDGFTTHAPVNHYRANPFGIHGMIGNVREWCLDWYDRGYPESIREGDGEHLLAPEKRREHVMRGGSFNAPATQGRSAFRPHARQAVRSLHFGVRPARALEL